MTYIQYAQWAALTPEFSEFNSPAHATATSTGETITVPSTTNSGDLMVLFQDGVNISGGGPSDVTPSGWSNVPGAGASVNPKTISAKYKIADSGDASSTVTGINGSDHNRKLILVFRGNGPITSVTVQDADVELIGMTGDPASQTITASGGTTPLLVFGWIGGNSLVGNSYSPAETDSKIVISGDRFRVFYNIYNLSPSNHDVDTGSNTRPYVSSFYLEVS